MIIQGYCTGPEILEKVDSEPLEYSMSPGQFPKKRITPFVFRKSGFRLSNILGGPKVVVAPSLSEKVDFEPLEYSTGTERNFQSAGDLLL